MNDTPKAAAAEAKSTGASEDWAATHPGLVRDGTALLKERKSVCASMVQRHARVGFATAFQLMQTLEDLKLVGPRKANGWRDVTDAGRAAAVEAIAAKARAVTPPQVDAPSAVDIPALMKDHGRLGAELREVTRVHEVLLEAILRNADADITGADEAPEYLAEFYVRHLEQQVDAQAYAAERSGDEATEDRAARAALEAFVAACYPSEVSGQDGRARLAQLTNALTRVDGIAGIIAAGITAADRFREERDEARAVIREIRDHLRSEGYLALCDMLPGWLQRAKIDDDPPAADPQ